MNRRQFFGATVGAAVSAALLRSAPETLVVRGSGLKTLTYKGHKVAFDPRVPPHTFYLVNADQLKIWYPRGVSV